jgi:hypothetical protein
MPDEVKTEENAPNSGSMVVKEGKPLFAPGHEKLGGKKKGYKSAKVILRKMLDEMNVEKDPTKMTILQAMFQAQVDMAIKKNDQNALQFLLQQAGEFVDRAVPIVEPTNFFNVESMKHIINNNSFLGIEEGDDEMIEEEAVEVNDLKLG